MDSMITFAVLQLLNVILGTLRSICTIKSNKHVGMIINVVSFTFYAVIVKMTGAQELWYVALTTAITNCIGFYMATWIFTKTQKDKLWRISVTLKYLKGPDRADITDPLKKYNIQYNIIKIEGGLLIDIYTYSQGESTLVKEVIDKHPQLKYSVVEIEKKL